MQTTDPDPAADLWEWAVEAYARPGTSEALIAVQDAHGLDVTVLLWRAWLHHLGRAPTSGALEAALALSAAMKTRVIDPLRAARRAWRDPPAALPAHEAEAAREAARAAEIAAERAQLAALAALPFGPAGGAGLHDAFAAYAAAAGAPHAAMAEAAARLTS